MKFWPVSNGHIIFATSERYVTDKAGVFEAN